MTCGFDVSLEDCSCKWAMSVPLILTMNVQHGDSEGVKRVKFISIFLFVSFPKIKMGQNTKISRLYWFYHFDQPECGNLTRPPCPLPRTTMFMSFSHISKRKVTQSNISMEPTPLTFVWIYMIIISYIQKGLITLWGLSPREGLNGVSVSDPNDQACIIWSSRWESDQEPKLVKRFNLHLSAYSVTCGMHTTRIGSLYPLYPPNRKD